MNAQDIKDFSDLGDETFFSYKGVKYCVPQPPRDQLTKLLRIHQEIVAHVNRKPPVKEGAEGAGDEVDEHLADNMDSLFGLQQKFVLQGVRKVNEAGQQNLMEQADLDQWPVRLIQQVVKMVMDTFATAPKEERPT